MIACCVARHNLCSTCGGASLTHDLHDKIFGGKRVYGVCLLIWVISFLTILPEVRGITGHFTWTNSPFGCDISCPDDGCLSVGSFLSIINSIVFMIIFYVIIIINMFRETTQIYGTEVTNHMSKLKSISRSISILIVAYLGCILPVVAFSWGYWPSRAEYSSYKTKAIFASIYWWLYGINFFIYLATSSRIREAYKKFIKDMWKNVTHSNGRNENEVTETSAFWIGLRYLDTT